MEFLCKIQTDLGSLEEVWSGIYYAERLSEYRQYLNFLMHFIYALPIELVLLLVVSHQVPPLLVKAFSLAAVTPLAVKTSIPLSFQTQMLLRQLRIRNQTRSPQFVNSRSGGTGLALKMESLCGTTTLLTNKFYRR